MEDQEEVTDLKPGEDHADSLVYVEDNEHEFAQETMVAAEELVEVNNRVHGSEERSIQPSSSLQDEFRHLIRYISLSCRWFDVL